MENSGKISSRFRFDINALRALAITLVIFYHFNIKGFSVGFIGVDIFFVISGFLMTQILLKMFEGNSFDYWQFIAARVKRIWPALIALILILTTLGVFLLPTADYYSFANQAKDALFFISNIEFSNGSGYFTSNIEERWFLHSWSLSVEWQFYCIYPLIIFALWHLIGFLKTTTNRRNVLNVTVLFLSIASYVYSIVLTKSDQPHAFFSLNTRAWEMLIGAHVLLLTSTKIGAWFRGYSSYFKFLSVLMFLSCVWLGHGGKWTLVWPGIFAIIPTVATGLYILSGNSNGFWKSLEGNLIVQSLGSWSYSIYLWHWPIVIALNFVWPNTASLKVRILGLLVSLILGFLSFKLIESVFRDKRKDRSFALAKIFSIYVLALVIVFAITNKNSAYSKFAIDQEKYINQNKLPKKFENQKLLPQSNLNVYTINENKTKKVVVVGDSHAEHLLPWFKHYASDYSVTFVVTNGCAPIPKTNRQDGTGWFCHNSFEKIQSLLENNTYDLVVISGNWYTIDNDPPGVCYINYVSCNHLNKDQNQKISVKSLSGFINSITKKNTPVLLLRPTPFANLSVSKVLPRYNLWDIEFPRIFKDQNFDTLSGDLFLNDVIESASNQDLIHIIDLRLEFCGNGVCHYFDDAGIPVFWDDNHFNSEWLIKHGSALFKVNSILNENANDS